MKIYGIDNYSQINLSKKSKNRQIYDRTSFKNIKDTVSFGSQGVIPRKIMHSMNNDVLFASIRQSVSAVSKKLEAEIQLLKKILGYESLIPSPEQAKSLYDFDKLVEFGFENYPNILKAEGKNYSFNKEKKLIEVFSVKNGKNILESSVLLNRAQNLDDHYLDITHYGEKDKIRITSLLKSKEIITSEYSEKDWMLLNHAEGSLLNKNYNIEVNKFFPETKTLKQKLLHINQEGDDINFYTIENFNPKSSKIFRENGSLYLEKEYINNKIIATHYD